jgi:hypothetical protein
MTTLYEQLPAQTDIKFVAGDNVSIAMVLLDAAVGIVLTSYTLSAWINIVDESGTVTALPFTVVKGNQTLAPGSLTLSLTDEQTVGLIGTYEWTFTWVDPDSNKRTLAVGNVTVSEYE